MQIPFRPSSAAGDANASAVRRLRRRPNGPNGRIFAVVGIVGWALALVAFKRRDLAA